MSKLSKNGWPLGKSNFHLGVIRVPYALQIAAELKARYGIEVRVLQVAGAGSDYLGLMIEDQRVSMEKYGEMKAYIAGYKAALAYWG